MGRANAVAELAGAPRSGWAWYFYAVTALLNAAFVAGHAPALDAPTRAHILPALGLLFVALLPAPVLAGIIAVEHARRSLTISRLAEIAEIAELRDLAVAPRADGRQNAPPSVVAAHRPEEERPALTVTPPPGGRPQQYRVEDLMARLGERATFTPAEAQRALGASESSVRRLLAEGQERGVLVRQGVGVYAPIPTPAR